MFCFYSSFSLAALLNSILSLKIKLTDKWLSRCRKTILIVKHMRLVKSNLTLYKHVRLRAFSRFILTSQELNLLFYCRDDAIQKELVLKTGSKCYINETCFYPIFAFVVNIDCDKIIFTCKIYTGKLISYGTKKKKKGFIRGDDQNSA